MATDPRGVAPGWRRVLFPDPPREFAARRAVKILLRGLHVACAGVYTGSHVFAVDTAPRITWLVAALASGTALLAVDLLESCVILLQLRGLVVLGKLAILAAVPWVAYSTTLPGLDVALLLLAMVAASVSSHAPSRWRYHMWAAGGRFAPSRSKG
ncbi:MAG: hypothetical protein IPM29_08230 [Planctomycetes bacterium]|nr:hypothetical protein [Planctomycetota bacterium]